MNGEMLDLNRSGGGLARSDTKAVAYSASRWLVASAVALVVCAFALLFLSVLNWSAVQTDLLQFGWGALREGGWIALVASIAALAAIAVLLGLVGFSASHDGHPIRFAGWWTLAAFFLFCAATLASAWIEVGSTLRLFRNVREQEQVAIARQKAVQIDEWTGERFVDLRFLVDTLKGFSLTDAAPRSEAFILAELVLSQFLSAYPDRISVGVFSSGGTPVVTQGQFDASQAEALAVDVQEAARTNRPYIGMLRAGGMRDTGLSLALILPMRTARTADADKLVVVSLIDPTTVLLKRFGEWPTSSKGTLALVFRANDQLVHIVDPDQKVGAEPLSVRVPVPEERLKKLVSDTRGQISWVGIGRDGAATLTATYDVKDMPWIVMARSNFNEAMAPVRRQVWAIWIATAVVIVFGGVLMVAVGVQLKLVNRLIED